MRYLKTQIKKEVWTENGENKVRYQAVASGINMQGIFWRERMKYILSFFIPDLYWMSEEEIDELLDHTERGSLERAQKIIDIYRSEVDKYNERREIEKEAKRKLTFYIKYPEDQ